MLQDLPICSNIAKIQEALFNVVLHDNLITLAHLNYFPSYCIYSKKASESKFFILLYSKLEIPWKNCIGFASDNCNVMIGRKNSVLTRVRERQPDVFNIGCICHLADLCVKAGVKQFSMAVDNLFLDVYFHFQNRSVYAVFFIVLFPHCKVYISIGRPSDWGHLDWILYVHLG